MEVSFCFGEANSLNCLLIYVYIDKLIYYHIVAEPPDRQMRSCHNTVLTL
jgi:hypothetical protein